MTHRAKVTRTTTAVAWIDVDARHEIEAAAMAEEAAGALPARGWQEIGSEVEVDVERIGAKAA